MFHVPDWRIARLRHRLLYAFPYSMASAVNALKYSMARVVFNGSFTEKFYETHPRVRAHETFVAGFKIS